MYTDASNRWIFQFFVLLSLPRSKGDQVVLFFPGSLDEKDGKNQPKLKVFDGL